MLNRNFNLFWDVFFKFYFRLSKIICLKKTLVYHPVFEVMVQILSDVFFKRAVLLKKTTTRGRSARVTSSKRLRRRF